MNIALQQALSIHSTPRYIVADQLGRMDLRIVAAVRVRHGYVDVAERDHVHLSDRRKMRFALMSGETN